MLIFAIQQCVSAVSVHICPPSWVSLPAHPTPLFYIFLKNSSSRLQDTLSLYFRGKPFYPPKKPLASQSSVNHNAAETLSFAIKNFIAKRKSKLLLVQTFHLSWMLIFEASSMGKWWGNKVNFAEKSEEVAGFRVFMPLVCCDGIKSKMFRLSS